MVAFKLNPTHITTATCGTARSPRRRVLLSGVFQSFSGTFPVSIRNLSCTGASIASDRPLKVGGEGVLVAGQLDCLCKVIWARGGFYGLQFDLPLSNNFVLELHRITESDVKRAETAAAKEWFHSQNR